LDRTPQTPYRAVRRQDFPLGTNGHTSKRFRQPICAVFVCSFTYASGRILNRPDLCDIITANAFPYFIIFMAMMAACFPDVPEVPEAISEAVEYQQDEPDGLRAARYAER
jgi:hypothetical protein